MNDNDVDSRPAEWVVDSKQFEILPSETYLFWTDVQEAERQRMATLLHDGPLQELHSLDFSLVALSQQLADENDQKQVAQIRSALQGVSKTLRNLCQNLRPPALFPFGLSAVLRSYIDNFEQLHPRIHFFLDLADDGQLMPERTRLALYRIFQHALDNIAEHSNARYVYVCLELNESSVELSIEDDGDGFVIPEHWSTWLQKQNFGLVGSMQWAKAVGGRLKVQAALQQGVRLSVIVPLVT